MNTANAPNADFSSFETDFVAYLDGELDAAASRRVEDLLARDEGARREFESLARVWDLLDELPRRALDASFARNTVEMIALSADEDERHGKSRWFNHRRRARLWCVVGLLVACAGGFAVVAALVPGPDRQLLEDLPLLEELDAYRQVDSIGFLRQLKADGVLTEEAGHDH